VERFGWGCAAGDKVMQVENDHERGVYDGDLGIVRRADPEEGELALAHATTVRKSQGSAYPAVVIPLTRRHFPMLKRTLVHTGVTRGRRLVVVVGQRRALALAARGGAARPGGAGPGSGSGSRPALPSGALDDLFR
jgi:exodeoxyribonuclease V alpha subunit